MMKRLHVEQTHYHARDEPRDQTEYQHPIIDIV
jgi:hypothetical protein